MIDWRRKWKRRSKWHHQPLETDDSFHIPELGSEENSPEDLIREKEFTRLFAEKLKSLPEEARVVFTLKELKGLSYDQIAETLKIKRGTVSSRLFYVRKKLKESLSEYIDEGEKHENP